MPELPEVETTRAGIASHLLGQTVARVIIRQPQLRLPISPELLTALAGQSIKTVERRAKYLLIGTPSGTLLLHLGMSGRLRIVLPDAEQVPGRHDHLDLILANGKILRLTDPRRFGLALWLSEDPLTHPWLRSLGPEPLSDDFHGDYLYQQVLQRTTAIKPLIMNGHIVVGVGNIYANEALFRSAIHPKRLACTISLADCRILVVAIQQVLQAAIAQGGTTLRDFQNSDGRPGYFQVALQVYGKAGEPCSQCGQLIQQQRLAQRATFFCNNCQH